MDRTILPVAAGEDVSGAVGTARGRVRERQTQPRARVDHYSPNRKRKRLTENLPLSESQD
ncbi:MAG: hypothetical protein CXZ00_07110 [Acidobacteria bacterium]|nr:MAG: hypothetical protein CXZ00_07110 [Acidobacteriota bacterium]